MARTKKSDAVPPDEAEVPAGDGSATAPAHEVQAETADADLALSEPVRNGDPDPLATVEAEPSLPRHAADPAPRRSGLFGPLLGGVIAAALGAGAVLYLLPQGWRPTDNSAALAADVDAIEQRLSGFDAVGDRVAALEESAAAGPADDPRIAEAASAAGAASAAAADLAARLDALAGQLTDMDERLSALEKRPVAGGAASGSAIAAFEREMEEMRQLIAEQADASAGTREDIEAAASAAEARIAAAEEEAARLKAEAEEAARLTSARAGLSHLQAALESGAPLQSAVAELEGAGVTVPAILKDQSQAVPSLAFLRSAFPGAARDALAASLAETSGGGWGERLSAFLRSQTGARSLTPRSGDDPDAILSRAEAALGAGDISAALTELGALPEAGRERMSEWIALAERRQTATSAVAELRAVVE